MLQIKISFHKSISINKICSINVQDLDVISSLAAAATLALRMFNFISLTLSLTAPCDPLYLTALGQISPRKIGLICPRAVSCGPL
jgi:hypothetical protein